MTAYQYHVNGRVQGVGYRYFVWRQARALGVHGSVRNRSDGSVLVIAQGCDEILRQFEELLREGPPYARVDEIRKEPVCLKENYKEFRMEV